MLGVFISSILFLLYKYILSRIFTFNTSKLSTFPTHVPQSVFTLNVTVLLAVLLSQPPVVKITKHVSIDVTTVAFLCYLGRHRHGDGGNFVQCVSPTVVVVENVLGVSTPHRPFFVLFFCLKGSRIRSCSCNFDFKGTDSYRQSYLKRYYFMIFSWLCSSL